MFVGLTISQAAIHPTFGYEICKKEGRKVDWKRASMAHMSQSTAEETKTSQNYLLAGCARNKARGWEARLGPDATYREHQALNKPK